MAGMATYAGRLLERFKPAEKVDMRLVLGPNNVLYEFTTTEVKHFLGAGSRDVTDDGYYHDRFDWAANARVREPITPRPGHRN